MKQKTAKYISVILFPYNLAIVTTFMVLRLTLPLQDSIYWTLFAFFFLVLIPSSYVIVQIMRKKITNMSVEVRSQRKQVYTVGMFSLMAACALFYAIEAPRILFSSFVFLLLLCVLAFAVNFVVHKTSAHMMGIGLTFSFLLQGYPTIAYFALGFAVLVAWSRYYLHKHTLPEIISGFAMSVGTGLIFSFYYLV
ncbi:hypothetical protein [Microscilla marina]|uniref:PAP2 family protein, putative n=1 Tax=Microscilla marina ATCC 23134 TaxID=313606 RepID=A1ZEX2_MICM2|nr:hypothetical protein [Microscilla marina]EAY31074.1 PAP2 family protein, putative [Microscilla marina ATCC 23134]